MQRSGLEPALEERQGQADGPVIRAVYPSPWTPQYREREDRPRIRSEPVPESIAAEGHVWTSLVNMVDFQSETFADKYLFGRAEQPYFARTVGWELQFWDPTTESRKAAVGLAHPVATIDLRAVLHVQAFKVRDEFFQVSLSMSEGAFIFHVRTSEEADMWAQCAAQALIQYTYIKQAKWQEGIDRAKDIVSHVEQAKPQMEIGAGGTAWNEGLQLRFQVSPEREASLRRIWIQCLRAVADGGAPPPQAFAEMFALYNFNMDTDLDLDELEIMLKELLIVRRDELEKAMAFQREQVVTPDRIMLNPDALVLWRKTVGDPGDKILKQYEHMLQRQGYKSRAVLMRSQLDTTHDNQVSLTDFVYGAPYILLSQRELFMEVQFFRGCAKMREEFLEDHEKEEPGCLQQ